MYLTESMVAVTKTYARMGYVDKNGLVYLPPKAAKRVLSWKKMMRARGFKFEGDA